MLNVRYTIKNLPFEYPFTISKGTKTHQSLLIIELTWRGISGYGEAPAISYYDVSTEKMEKDLVAKMKFIESFSLTDPKRFWHFLHHLFPSNPFLVSALDMAGWDLYAKLRKVPLYRLWELDLSNAPQTDYTIGIDSIEKMLEKIERHPAPIYKIKVGSINDLEILTAIRKITASKIRLDANAGWTYTEAMNIIPELEKLDIELIEQPLAKESFKEIRSLQEKTSIPLIADESCVSEKDIDPCIGCFSGINIKLTKSSGITPSLRMINKAKASGLKVMLGCMNESTIGTAAIAHMSPLVDYLDADGPLLLKEDTANGLEYQDHYLKPSDYPGLGIFPNSNLF